MGNRLHDTSVDPEPIIADLRPRLAELDEAVEQQTATAEVLRVINSSARDLRARLGRMLDKAMRLYAGRWRKFSTSVIYPVAPNPCD
jgi:hypothetical protein